MGPETNKQSIPSASNPPSMLGISDTPTPISSPDKTSTQIPSPISSHDTFSTQTPTSASISTPNLNLASKPTSNLDIASFQNSNSASTSISDSSSDIISTQVQSPAQPQSKPLIQPQPSTQSQSPIQIQPQSQSQTQIQSQPSARLVNNPFRRSSARLANSPLSNLRDDQVVTFDTPSPKKIVPKKSLFILIAVGLVIAIIVVSILFSKINQHTKNISGTRKKEDLISLIKLYQYGNPEEQKEISVNLPSNYAYAAKMLIDTASRQDRFAYANNLYNAYRTYAGEGSIYDFILLYKMYMQLDTTILEIRDTYLEKDEDSAKDLIINQMKPTKTLKSDYLKEHFGTVEQFFYDNLEYYKQLDQAGCRKDNAIDEECATEYESNRHNRPDFDFIYSEIQALRSSMTEKYSSIYTEIGSTLVEYYKQVLLKKETKK